ncbi:hypothetical protein [Sagittula sp. NFXS13]|uniref:hypothetical protein n=1 Tax=Sagittula sp. NFXS13 TaxID=2819095 RepID=UPI0032E02D66
MRGLTALSLAGLLLAGCSTQAQDQIARSAARSTVNRVLLERLPAGIPLQPSIDCVINNASAPQIYALASDTLGGPTQSSVEIVTQVVSKPETTTCLATQGLPALLR